MTHPAKAILFKHLEAAIQELAASELLETGSDALFTPFLSDRMTDLCTILIDESRGAQEFYARENA